MDENQSNHNMLPNKTEVEHLAGGSEENDDENGDQGVQQRTTQLVATTSDGRNHVVSVPVSVGLQIGQAFNVLTPDQLPHFKQMLCVDSNGFLSGNTTLVGTDGGDLKGYVIQHQPQPQQQQQNSVVDGGQQQQQQQQLTTVTVQQQQHQQEIATITVGSPTDDGHDLNQAAGGLSAVWETVNSSEVLSIRCKSTTAELYKSRLGSGGRGRCVKYKDEWYTPSEFENVCGRGSSKDWKRSIRYGGRSLQALIDEGVLTPHATSCTCAACCDDESTSGPVRLFTPYKRRRRNQITPDSTRNVQHSKQKKTTAEQDPESEEGDHHQQQMSNNSGGSVSVATKEEPNWQTITDGLDVVSNDYLNAATAAASTAALAAHVAQAQQQTAPTAGQSNYSVYSDATQPFDRLQQLCAQMTKTTNEFRRCISEAKEMHQRQVEKLQQERDTALLAARVHDEMDDPNNGLDMPTTKKCANCNREAMAECSLCRRTPYCSTFCQRKDWNAHQVECARDPNEGTQQIMLLVEDQ